MEPKLNLAASLGMKGFGYKENMPEGSKMKSNELAFLPTASLEAILSNPDPNRSIKIKYKGNISLGPTIYDGTTWQGDPTTELHPTMAQQHELSAIWNGLEVGVRKDIWNRFLNYVENFEDTDLIVGYNHKDKNLDLDIALKGFIGLDNKLKVDFSDRDDMEYQLKPENGMKLELQKKFKDFVLGGSIGFDNYGESEWKQMTRDGEKLNKARYPSGNKLNLELFLKQDLF